MNKIQAEHLRIRVTRESEVKVDLKMPAHCALWIVKLLPEDIIDKIKNSHISLEDIQARFNSKDDLYPQEIFNIKTSEKEINVWLE